MTEAGVRWRELLAARPAAWREAATRWDALAEGVRIQAEALAPKVEGLPKIWRGVAADEAGRHLIDLMTRSRDAYASVSALAQVLDQHAIELSALQGSAAALVQNAELAGLRVGPDGTVRPADGLLNESVARAVTEVVWQRDALLRAAAGLDQETIAAIRAHLPTAAATAAKVDVAAVPKPGTDPRAVKAWWDALTAAQRRELVTAHPELVGGLDGVPVADRDVANRLLLDQVRASLVDRRAELAARGAYIRDMIAQGRGAELYPPSYRRNLSVEELARIDAELRNIDGKLRGIDRIHARLTSADPTEPRAYLMGISAGGDGRAILAIGNPDEADNVLTYVPGTGADLSKVGGDIDRTDMMIADARMRDPAARTAGIFWLDFDAPDDILNAASSSYAADAAADLDRFTAGLRVTHDGDASHNIVLGHSYGTTVIGEAAMAGAGINADDLIFVGSPGVDTNTVTDLKGVAAGHVWATRADNDLIRRVPDWDLAHGNDPIRDDFGARVFTSDPGDPDNEAATHSAYWKTDNAARLNIARIVVGDYATVT